METQPTDPYATLGVPRTATQPEIRKAYLKLVREHPPEADPEAFARINDAYAVLGNAEKRAAFDAAPVWPADALEAAKEAVAAAHAERFDDACRLLEPVVAKRPGFEPLERLYAQSLLGAERYADAAPIWRRVVEAHPADVGALYMLGVAVGAGGKGDMEEAVRLLKRAVTLAPDDPECAIGLGRTYLRMGRADDAVDAVVRGLERTAAPGAARLALRVELLRIARRTGSSSEARAARDLLKTDLESVDGATRADAVARLLKSAKAFAKEGRSDLAADLMDDAAPLTAAPAEAAKIADAFRRDHAAREELRTTVATIESPWLAALAQAAVLDRDRGRTVTLLRELALSAADPKVCTKRRAEWDRVAETRLSALAELAFLVDGALVAGAHFPPDSSRFRLLCDPDVAPWIKDLLLFGEETRPFSAWRQLASLLTRFVADDPATKRATMERVAAAYPDEAETLRTRFDAFASGPPTSDDGIPAAASELLWGILRPATPDDFARTRLKLAAALCFGVLALLLYFGWNALRGGGPR